MVQDERTERTQLRLRRTGDVISKTAKSLAVSGKQRLVSWRLHGQGGGQLEMRSEKQAVGSCRVSSGLTERVFNNRRHSSV